jgi:hypothetical protein
MSDHDKEMYGWGPPQEPPQGPQTLSTLKEEGNDSACGPQSVVEEPCTLKEEPQTLQDAPITFSAGSPPPQSPDEKPVTLQQPPQEPQVGADEGTQACTGTEPNGSDDDYFYFNGEHLSEADSDEDEVPDGDGAIKPYISRFNERFPLNLSWNDIAVDPLSR